MLSPLRILRRLVNVLLEIMREIFFSEASSMAGRLGICQITFTEIVTVELSVSFVCFPHPLWIIQPPIQPAKALLPRLMELVGAGGRSGCG